MNILITGGASGLGEAITRKLAQNKENNIYFTFSNSEEKANTIAREFSNAQGFKCDFKSEESVAELLIKLDTFDLDVLVNNAITGLHKKHFHKMYPEEFLNSFRYNILPTIKITQAAIHKFRKKKFGKIITVLTSAIINKPPIGWSDYVASKEYLYSLNKSWATENIAFNITANCISPAFMQTNLTADTDERLIEEMEKNHPLKKMLLPQEVAEAASYLIGATQQINGTNLVINAGSDLL